MEADWQLDEQLEPTEGGAAVRLRQIDAVRGQPVAAFHMVATALFIAVAPALLLSPRGERASCIRRKSIWLNRPKF